jgi:hypothetical protein
MFRGTRLNYFHHGSNEMQKEGQKSPRGRQTRLPLLSPKVVHGPALIDLNGLVVIRQVGGKNMGAVIFRDKIERLRISRTKDGFQGCASRATNGPWRQGGDNVGVVRCLFFQISFGQVAVKIANAINNGGV